MDKNKLLEKTYKESSLKTLKNIKTIYDRLEIKQKLFCNKFCLHCKEDCGTCCEHFIPEITELESDFLAYGIIKENHEEEVYQYLVSIKDKEIVCCPLYNKSKHCTEYIYRPLICRLFNASAVKDKYGNPTFKNCKYNINIHEITTDMLKDNPEVLVIMSDYGQDLEDVVSGSCHKELLPNALIKSIDKIRYLMELLDNE